MRYQLQLRKYARPFKRPLETAAGCWEAREGIIVRLEDEEGRVGFGEVAPLPAFGSERLGDARDWLASLGGKWEDGMVVPGELGCCGFAVSGALRWLEGKFEKEDRGATLETAALLPTGEAALARQEELLARGYQVFKWKVGIGSMGQEMEIAHELASKGKLRLDGNMGLGEDLERWLEWMAGEADVEFMEQPWPTGRWAEVQRLAQIHGVESRMALDEEVTSRKDIRKLREAGWQGLFVLKSALAGAIEEDAGEGVIHSSALETGIGRETALRLAVGSGFAVGFGVGDLFGDNGLELHPAASTITTGLVGTKEMEAIWERI